MSVFRRLQRGATRYLDARLPFVLSRLRRRWLILRHPEVELDIHPTAFIGPGFRLVAPYGARLTIGPYCEFRRGGLFELGPGAEITMGTGVIFTAGALVQISTRLEIGDRVGLGQNVAIFDGSHGFDEVGTHWLEQQFRLRPVVIGDGVGIHSKVSITASIGAATMVGANAVVNRDLPAGVMAAGVPARIIRRLGEGSAT